ncbi:predicted protein [Naegleria gruberi]|uniref:Predicted protein n=1 Tax=Naegleria gruberi TaxID=5762 RepID=D2V233_NAEGR|nr:uncharacterized protein NAEGRDRAFT_62862 [Naegleria gruberi]EFC48834.1 predicted protein [Naegleria gruberi]|eukprot:XP_002681578.1 predicted protein [Naegleria gruberi strain NEG-M]
MKKQIIKKPKGNGGNTSNNNNQKQEKTKQEKRPKSAQIDHQKTSQNKQESKSSQSERPKSAQRDQKSISENKQETLSEKDQKLKKDSVKKDGRQDSVAYSLPKIDRSLFSYEYIPEYSFENVQELIKNGNLEKAAQVMNLVLNPSIECLCYALNVNQRINNSKKVAEIGARIDKLVGLKAKAKKIKLNYNWKQIWPYLDYLIDETCKDSSIIEREIEFNLKSSKCESYTEEDDSAITKYCEWNEEYFKQLRYPFAFGTGRNNFLTSYIKLSNYTMKEMEARKLDFHFFKGEMSEENICPSTFYNLIARVGLTRDHLLNGKHGFKDMIRVFPYKVESSLANSESFSQDVEKYINNKLENTHQPYVVFVFSFDSDFTVKRGIVNYYNAFNIYPSATIIETTENRVYYCFENNRKKTIDLHKMSVEEAKTRVLELIQERYEYRDREFSIITGKGNHVNENGTSGVLRELIGKLLKEHPLVESAKLLEGKYVVKIKERPFDFLEQDWIEFKKTQYNK